MFGHVIDDKQVTNIERRNVLDDEWKEQQNLPWYECKDVFPFWVYFPGGCRRRVLSQPAWGFLEEK